jgi:hypothetical protein
MCIVLHSEKKRQCFEKWLFFRQFKREKTSTRLVPVQSTDCNHWKGFDLLLCAVLSSVWQRLLSDNWSWVCEKLCEDRFYTFLWSTRYEAHSHWVWIINSYTGWGHAMFHFRYVPTFRKKQQSLKIRYLAHKLHGVRSQKTFSWYL